MEGFPGGPGRRCRPAGAAEQLERRVGRRRRRRPRRTTTHYTGRPPGSRRKWLRPVSRHDGCCSDRVAGTGSRHRAAGVSRPPFHRTTGRAHPLRRFPAGFEPRRSRAARRSPESKTSRSSWAMSFAHTCVRGVAGARLVVSVAAASGDMPVARVSAGRRRPLYESATIRAGRLSIDASSSTSGSTVRETCVAGPAARRVAVDDNATATRAADQFVSGLFENRRIMLPVRTQRVSPRSGRL